MVNYIIFFLLLVIAIGMTGYFYKKSKQTAKIVACFWLALAFDGIYSRGEFSVKVLFYWLGFVVVVFVADIFANTGIKKE